METLEVVDEHIGDPEVIEELKGHWVPELGLDGVVCPDSKKKFLWVVKKSARRSGQLLFVFSVCHLLSCHWTLKYMLMVMENSLSLMERMSRISTSISTLTAPSGIGDSSFW